MRYSEYMKLSTRCAVLKQQIDEEMNLIGQLQEDPEMVSHYAAHNTWREGRLTQQRNCRT